MSTTSRDSDETARRGPLDPEKELELSIPKLDETSPSPTLTAPIDVEKAQVPSLAASNGTDWDGPDDPENPQNWPAWKRHMHIIPPALVSFAA